MIDDIKDALETTTYLIVIGETMIKVGKWILRKSNKKAPQKRQSHKRR